MSKSFATRWDRWDGWQPGTPAYRVIGTTVVTVDGFGIAEMLDRDVAVRIAQHLNEAWNEGYKRGSAELEAEDDSDE